MSTPEPSPEPTPPGGGDAAPPPADVLTTPERDEDTAESPDAPGGSPEERRREYLELRRFADQMEQDAAKSFDQAMLTLSAGSFALAVAFIEKVAPNPLPWTYPFLMASWAFFLWSILCVLHSFLYTQEAARDYRGKVDATYNPEDSAPPSPSRRRSALERKFGAVDPFGEAIDVLNWRSVHVFIWGAVFLSLFSLSNLIAKGSIMAKHDDAPHKRKDGSFRPPAVPSRSLRPPKPPIPPIPASGPKPDALPPSPPKDKGKG